MRLFRFLILLTAAVMQAQQIEVYHKTAYVETGASRQFTAYVPLSPSTVVWSVNGITGGNSTVGTVTQAGLYQAPASAPTPSLVKLRATSTAFPDKFGEADVYITRKTPYIWSASPSTLPVGAFQVTLNGANFTPDAQVRLNGMPLQTTYSSATRLTATGTMAQGGAAALTVYLPDPGAVTSQALNVTFANQVSVTVTPATATVTTGATQAFAATVSNTSNTAVTWRVNGIAGGNSTVGTITSGGIYTAPAAAGTVTVSAVSVADATKSGSATVTVQQPALTITPSSATVNTGATQSFSANAAVSWQVNGVTGGSAVTGTISAAGLYTAPSVVPSPATVTVRAVSQANAGVVATASVTIAGQGPAVPLVTAGRFLEQAAFGPRPAEIAKVQQLGINGWLDEQFALAESTIPDQASTASLRAWTLANYAHAPDQLRQRVAYALSQIIVVSLNKNIYPNEILPWMRLLNKHAFGSYRQLLRDVTVSPSMGKYLDLANSARPMNGSAANENYPRELLQLFSIGLWELNPDGSQKLNGANQPISAYNETTVKQVALALTGWTYPTQPGQTPGNTNWEYFVGEMESRQARHDTTAKSFLGCNLPANQTVEQDLEATIDCVFQHPNVPPFIAVRLIRSLVKSNPSPAYIARVANVFGNNGQNVRGDLKAVVRAILTDPEARQNVPDATSGRLKDHLYFTAAFIRALNGTIATTNGAAYHFDNMGQSVLAPPSVFSWFSPVYRVPNQTLFGPEFQIYTATQATLRGNLFYHVLTSQSGGDMSIDLSNFTAVAGNTSALLDEVDRVFFYGRMDPGVRQAIATAVDASYDNNQRVQTAVYLAALSGQYAVQY